MADYFASLFLPELPEEENLNHLPKMGEKKEKKKETPQCAGDLRWRPDVDPDEFSVEIKE